MARPSSSPDGRPRVHLSATISAQAYDVLMSTTAKLKSKNAKANIGHAVDSLVEFSVVRRFDPIAPLDKIMRPAKASTPPPAKSTTPSGQKG